MTTSYDSTIDLGTSSHPETKSVNNLVKVTKLNRVKVKIENKVVECVIDSGAEISVFKTDMISDTTLKDGM